MSHEILVQMRVLKAEGLDSLLIDPSTKTYPMIVQSFNMLSKEQLAQLEADINRKYRPNVEVYEIKRVGE